MGEDQKQLRVEREQTHNGPRALSEEPAAAPASPDASRPAPHAPPPARPNAPDHTRRRRRFLALFASIVLLVVAILALRECNRGENAQKTAKAPPGSAITTGQSTTGDTNVSITALGTVTPAYTVSVYSQITGRVMAVHYTQGQMVNRGDPLIDIDPRPYEAMLTQAEGTLAHDRGLLEQAEMDLRRYQAAQNAIARQTLEDQQKLVILYRGTVKADEGTVAYDQTQLSYCHIVAPISGRVGLRLVDPGNTVFAGSNSTLVVITQLRPITVVFDVSEDDLPQIRTQLRGNHKLSVTVYDRSNENQIASGTLTSLDNQVDTTTGTVKFRADFPNRDLSLFPNQFVNAKLLVKTLRRVTLVPSAAVQYNGTSAFVYVIKPDHTASVQPVTALTGNDRVTAVQGLNAGVSVATSGFDRLENGTRVIIRNEGAAQENSGAGLNSKQGATDSTAP